uniref:Uncharacterized protein n=1 Tax=Opuntia streptacantha TaxID=393608 RepID=A0A7C8Z7X2_OPUST
MPCYRKSLPQDVPDVDQQHSLLGQQWDFAYQQQASVALQQVSVNQQQASWEPQVPPLELQVSQALLLSSELQIEPKSQNHNKTAYKSFHLHRRFLDSDIYALQLVWPIGEGGGQYRRYPCKALHRFIQARHLRFSSLQKSTII